MGHILNLMLRLGFGLPITIFVKGEISPLTTYLREKASTKNTKSNTTLQNSNLKLDKPLEISTLFKGTEKNTSCVSLDNWGSHVVLKSQISQVFIEL